jgi:hypothetical protein
VNSSQFGLPRKKRQQRFCRFADPEERCILFPRSEGWKRKVGSKEGG